MRFEIINSVRQQKKPSKAQQPRQLRNPHIAAETPQTDAQAEGPGTKYRNALVTVMGDDSDHSRQNAVHLTFAFYSLLSMFSETDSILTEEVIRATVPMELLHLAVQVDWIPYLDGAGDPLPEKLGDDVVVGFYGFTQEFYDAYCSLLPIEDVISDAKKTWVHPTPAELVQEVLEELTWGKIQLIEQMQIVNGTQHTLQASEQVFVIPQDSKERHQLNTLLKPPGPNARRNTAQDDARKTVAQVIRNHSAKYASLADKQLVWRRPEA